MHAILPSQYMNSAPEDIRSVKLTGAINFVHIRADLELLAMSAIPSLNMYANFECKSHHLSSQTWQLVTDALWVRGPLPVNISTAIIPSTEVSSGIDIAQRKTKSSISQNGNLLYLNN